MSTTTVYCCRSHCSSSRLRAVAGMFFTTMRQAAALCQAVVDNGGVTAVPGTLSSLSAETTRWQPRPIMHLVAGYPLPRWVIGHVL
jgi:hypothetical protein